MGDLIWVPMIWETKHFAKIVFITNGHVAEQLVFLNLEAPKVIDVVVCRKIVKEV